MRGKRERGRRFASATVVVVLIGQDTHNAQGVIVETDMARSLGKPVIQVKPQNRTYQGLTRLDDPIPWKWTAINHELDQVANRLNR